MYSPKPMEKISNLKSFFVYVLKGINEKKIVIISYLIYHLFLPYLL